MSIPRFVPSAACSAMTERLFLIPEAVSLNHHAAPIRTLRNAPDSTAIVERLTGESEYSTVSGLSSSESRSRNFIISSAGCGSAITSNPPSAPISLKAGVFTLRFTAKWICISIPRFAYSRASHVSINPKNASFSVAVRFSRRKNMSFACRSLA